MNIDTLREEINAVDDDMLELFIKRMELSEKIAQYKLSAGIPLLDRRREREILADVMSKSGDYEQYAYHFFSTIFQLSKARQSVLMSGGSTLGARISEAVANGDKVFPQTGTIACQGIEGSYSQMACDKLLPRGNIIFMKSFQSVFNAVESGLCRFGVLPIENSSNGSVRAVYELLQKEGFSIVRSVRICIRHELLVKPGTKLSDIRQIYSHEQALGQCSRFLSSLPNVTVTPCANTAVAAKMVSDSDLPCAAIASHSCSALYGLEPLDVEIQDSDNNYTRFICISKEPVIYAGANKISIIIYTTDTPGALYSVLSRFAALGINMGKLESCPVSGRNFEFTFFIELEASVSEPGVVPMLDGLERDCGSFRFLGNYQEI